MAWSCDTSVRPERWTDPLAGGNCYVVAQDGAALVVDPCAAAGPLELLKRWGLTPELILLTHEHCDHTAGLEPMRARYPGARVVCSAPCCAGIRDSGRNMSRRMEVYLTFAGKPGVRYPPFVCRSADETFEGEHELAWRGHTLRFVPLPGHTAGSVGIFLDGGVLFSGDYLLPGAAPVLRLPGGDEAAFEAVTRPRLAALPPGLWVCPGHGAPFTLTEKELSDRGL